MTQERLGSRLGALFYAVPYNRMAVYAESRAYPPDSNEKLGERRQRNGKYVFKT